MFTPADIEKYFNSEKQESVWFVVFGLAAVLAAILFFLLRTTNFYKGAAIPFLLVGLLLAVVGWTVYRRSDGDRIRNVYAYSMNPSELKTKEIPRMQTVMRNFVVYRYVEIALAVIGLCVFIYFRNNSTQVFWKGLGTGLVIMALLALTADYFAERRGHVYIQGLQSFTETIP